VENRQTKNDHVVMPRLFDLYPENIYSGRYPEHRSENAKIMQQPLPFYPSTPSFKSSKAIEIVYKPTTKQEYCCNDDENSRLFNNRPYTKWEQPLAEESPDTEDSRLFNNRPYIKWEQPLAEKSSDTDDDFDNDNRNNDKDPRLLINRPSVRWEPYLQSLNTDDDYNTDNKYRAASYRQGDSQIFYTKLLPNAMTDLPDSYKFVPKQESKENQQQDVHQELEENLQVKILILT